MADNMVRVLHVVGDRWALQIVREIALGLRRFDEIQSATRAPRTVLSDRLHRLTEAGILTTRPYQLPGRRTQREYLLTEAGLDLFPVMSALSDWGERYLGADAVPEIVYRHIGCGGRVAATLQCECGAQPDPHDRLVVEVNR